MNSIKNKIKENIITPEAESYSYNTITGRVIKSNEITCTCDIKFNNTKGVTETRSNVPILNYNTSIIDWFPKENDLVILQFKNDKVYVSAPADSGKNVRAKMKLKDDILSDTFLDNICGYIF